jgi:hypothetical protein
MTTMDNDEQFFIGGYIIYRADGPEPVDTDILIENTMTGDVIKVDEERMVVFMDILWKELTKE